MNNIRERLNKQYPTADRSNNTNKKRSYLGISTSGWRKTIAVRVKRNKKEEIEINKYIPFKTPTMGNLTKSIKILFIQSYTGLYLILFVFVN